MINFELHSNLNLTENKKLDEKEDSNWKHACRALGQKKKIVILA